MCDFFLRIDSQHARANKQRTLFFYCRFFDNKIQQKTGICEMVHELKREKCQGRYCNAILDPKRGPVIVGPSTAALLKEKHIADIEQTPHLYWHPQRDQHTVGPM